MKITGVRPWLVKASFSYWGEYLFVEVTTDEGISGWGEITSTTKIANRALASILKQVGEQIKGEDASQIHKGQAPQILAKLRNAAISFLRHDGATNIAAALRANAYQVHQLFAKLGIVKK